jgi:integrase/recombinase XerC
MNQPATPSSPRRPAPVGVRLPVPEDWARAIDDYLLDRIAAGKPATSRRTWKEQLEHLARRIEGGPFEQTRISLRRYVNQHPGWAQETRRSRRTTMVGFYDWALDDERMPDAAVGRDSGTGAITQNPARQLPTVPATTPAPRPAPDAVYQQALNAAKPRERLMLRLAMEVALRRGEVAQLSTSDIEPGFGGGYRVRVHGKGSKDRVVPLPAHLAAEILALPAGFAFPGDRAGHLSAEHVGRLTTALIPAPYTLHTLRHAFATRAYQGYGDIVAVQEMLGHANPTTTMRYVLTDNEEKLRRMVEGLSAPRYLPKAG